MTLNRTSVKWNLALLILAALGFSETGIAEATEVTGSVLEQGSMTPIADAIVSLQASGVRTTAESDGSFVLSVADGNGLVIVGAAKGYFNQSVTVDTPASGVQILLDPVPQDDDPNYSFEPPFNCAGCHPHQYEEWYGSPMADAGVNTWVHDIYNGTGTTGGMGGFVYTRDSAFADTNPNSECAACHQPEPWIQTPHSRLEGPQDPGYPSLGVSHGISCEACHKVADVDVAKINFPGIFPGAVTFTRPQGPTVYQVEYGVLGDTNFLFPDRMRPSYQPQLVAEVCGACHQDKNDPDENHTYTGITSEPTYIEWINSPYSDAESPFYANCVDCHMPPSGETEACSILFPPLLRDPNTIRSHRIEGTTPFFLENAVELTMQTEVVGDSLEVDVSIANTLTGHHVPTGVTVRNMILLVEAWREGEDPIGSPLGYTGTQTVHDLGGIGDPVQGYYAGLPGKLYAKVNYDSNGNGPTFFTDAAGIQFDNRIPALATDATLYTFDLPNTNGDIHVRARLIYRRAFRFLVDAKQWTEDGQGNPLGDIAAPHYGHLMEMAEATVTYCRPPEAIMPACIVPTAESFCPGSIHTVSAPTGMSSYLWSISGGTLLDGQGTDTVSFEAGFGTDVKIELTIVDDYGCENACTLSVDVADDEPPEITHCPDVVNVSLNENCVLTEPRISIMLDTSDNCTAREDLLITTDPEATSTLALGDNAVTVTVADASGNATRCEVTVRVEFGDCTDDENTVEIPDPATNDCCGGGTPLMMPFTILGWTWIRRRRIADVSSAPRDPSRK